MIESLIAEAEEIVRKAKHASDLAKTWAARNSSAKRSIAVVRKKLATCDRINPEYWKNILAGHELNEKISAQKMAETVPKVKPAEEAALKKVGEVAHTISCMPNSEVKNALMCLFWKL